MAHVPDIHKKAILTLLKKECKTFYQSYDFQLISMGLDTSPGRHPPVEMDARVIPVGHHFSKDKPTKQRGLHASQSVQLRCLCHATTKRRARYSQRLKLFTLLPAFPLCIIALLSNGTLIPVGSWRPSAERIWWIYGQTPCVPQGQPPHSKPIITSKKRMLG